MKPVRARGLRNKFQTEKLEGCVVLGQNQTPSQDIRAIWFPPYVFGGRGVWILWNLGLFPESHREPRKTSAGKHTRLHIPRVMHVSTGLSGLQYIFSVYTFSQNCSVRQESLCHIPNGDIHAESLSGLLKVRIHVFVFI